MNKNIMLSKPIIFNKEMIKAIFEGRKTITRRVIKSQPEIIYSLTDERLSVIHNKNIIYEENYNEKNYNEKNSNFSKRRLHGRKRREDLLTDSIRWFWEKGVRGMVCAIRSHKQSRLFDCFLMPQLKEGNKDSSQIDLHGFSRDASYKNTSSSTSEWKSSRQYTGKLEMGNTSRKLDGQENTWEWDKWGETPNVKIIRQGEGAYSICCKKGILQSSANINNSEDVTVCYFRDMPWNINQKLWVRETWAAIESLDVVIYKAGDAEKCIIDRVEKWKSPIFMPKKYARIWLEITGIRVEKLNDISKEDAIKEGIQEPSISSFSNCYQIRAGEKCISNECPITVFRLLWDSIHKKENRWQDNPWVFVVEFNISEVSKCN